MGSFDDLMSQEDWSCRETPGKGQKSAEAFKTLQSPWEGGHMGQGQVWGLEKSLEDVYS